MHIHNARYPGICLLLLVFLLAAPGVIARAAEIDRLLAAVNGKIITGADLKLARDLNALVLFGKEAENSSPREGIDRLVDLELMRQELASFAAVDEDPRRIEGRLLEIKNAYAEIGGLPALLGRLGLQESELISYLQLQDSILQFVNFRFRPFAHVAPEEIQNHYQTILVPMLREARSPLPALAEVAPKIEEILKEEKVNSLLDQWMKSLREDSRIEYFSNASGIPPGEEP